MQTTTIKLYSLDYGQAQTYLYAFLFVIGNIILPQMCHAVNMGGPMWLPIYFFTLIGAYKYGWKVGVLTAFASPVANSLLFGMPSIAVLPAILVKSFILAGVAGYMAQRFKQVSIILLGAVVFSYQVLGALGEWVITSSFHTAIQDLRIGIPGMLVQVFGGWLLIRHLMTE